MRRCDLDLERSTSKMVYIKDYWRPEEREKGGKIYQSLEKKNVSIFPDFTMETIYVIKYAGTILFRRDTITL